MRATTAGQRLLEKLAPTLEEYPARIEALQVAAFDVRTAVTDQQNLAGEYEEEATTEASTESNADKRKLRRAELLRDNQPYQAIKSAIREAERVELCLTERAARLRREYRLALVNLETQALKMRA